MARAPGVRSIVREALKPGIKTREVTVKPRKKGKAEEPPAEEAPVSPEDLTPEPPAPDAPVVVKPIEPLPPEATEELIKKREAQIGTPRQVPSPTKAQKEAGLEEGRINTRFYDDDELAATVQAFVENVEAPKKVTIQSLFDRARSVGASEENLLKIYTGNMTVKVGDNQLATQLAGLVDLHDQSAMRVDDLVNRITNDGLDAKSTLELQEAMAQHNVIVSRLQGQQTDIARAMNVFKRANVAMPDVTSGQIQDSLGVLGTPDGVLAFAEKWKAVAGDRKKQNKLLSRSLGARIYDAVIYAAQSSMLSNPLTHAYNFAATSTMLADDFIIRGVAIPVGLVRTRLAPLLNRQFADERIELSDIGIRFSAVGAGILDGFRLIGPALKQSGAKGEQRRNPYTSDYLFGREVSKARGDGLFKRGFAAGLDGLGMVYSISFKGIAAVDEFIGGIGMQMQLHDAAQVDARAAYINHLKGNPNDTAGAEDIARKTAAAYLETVPADAMQDAQAFRKMITMQADFDLDTRTGKAAWKTQKLLNSYLMKPFAMFSRTITQIASEGAGRVPVLNYLSPRFHSDWKKGGIRRDMAVARVAVGGSVLMGSYTLATMDILTGTGPGDYEARNNLRQLGWQPNSLKFGADMFTPGSVKAINKLLPGTVTVGRGQFDGQIFVSLNRLEPVTIPLMLATAYADTTRYAPYDPDMGVAQQMFGAGAAALAEFSTNIPVMTAFADIIDIATSYKRDAGERMLDIFNKGLETYANVAIQGSPLGIPGSSLSAAFERMIDPAASETAVNEAQADLVKAMGGDPVRTPGLSAFFVAYNKFRSRIPGLSKGVPPKLDPLDATPVGEGKAMGERFGIVSSGRPSLLREYLDQLNYFVGEPPAAMISKTRRSMPAEMENRFKQLYAQEVIINGRDMQTALLEEIEGYISEYEQKDGEKLPLGVVHGTLDRIVGDYRKAAREVMFGEIVKAPGDKYIQEMRPVGVKYGLSDDYIEYPEASQELKKRLEKLTALGGR
jgi:hypothetical protein